MASPVTKFGMPVAAGTVMIEGTRIPLVIAEAMAVLVPAIPMLVVVRRTPLAAVEPRVKVLGMSRTSVPLVPAGRVTVSAANVILSPAKAPSSMCAPPW